MIKVLIWENAFLIGALKHPGHSAIAITEGATAQDYISWWPAATSDQDRARGFRKGKANEIDSDYRAELGPRARQALEGGAAPRVGQSNDPVIFDHGINIQNFDTMQLGNFIQIIVIRKNTAIDDLGHFYQFSVNIIQLRKIHFVN